MLSIYQAAYEGKLFIVQQMIEKDDTLVNSFDNDGRNAIHWAASGGHVDIVDYLLNKGAMINSQDKEAGWTPLLIAVSAGHTNVVKLLLDKGADPSIENETKQSVLHYAASKNRIDICKVLLEHNAPVNQLNKYKQTPL
ncbi:26S proteasome non-ATPase regulatory subunit 10-like protein [Cokeromyces recurvatus]|uniref:26S proteasome non-ATPase regulatory subunit 10-like protein n=1 Tax=Cokeromyces recurvatus TaxID=90255 RepID=UPI00221F81BF|nr:26S proteasome non-ATPase regulatory subunit 10-like protein [Cokeromyces recurvatus]KAI7902177.1 26S proteasome non-ATPase regulatory subunit 10-like protein [Cokeromyces recurvatus]